MNKSIITILLALVAMAGQAQVKTGLDLCLRDEATGEWLILELCRSGQRPRGAYQGRTTQGDTAEEERRHH